MGMGLQPIARYLVSIVLFGVFAIFYATCGFMLRGRYLTLILPMVLVEIVVIGQVLRSIPPELCRSRTAKSMYSVRRFIGDRLQLVENTGLHVHRILCIASVHQRYRRKVRFSLGSEISSRKPLCGELSMNTLDFGTNHSGDAQTPDQALGDCVS